MVTWSTWMPRSVSSSSTSRYDSAKRSYHRTASTTTSGGKQNPTNADRAAGAGRGRRGLVATVCPLWARPQQVQQSRDGTPHSTAGWFTRLAGRLGLTWSGTLPPKITVVWGGRQRLVAELAGRLPWRGGRGLACARPRSRSPPQYGTLRLVTRNRHDSCESPVTNDRAADLTRVVERKLSRWSVETIFRDTKQYAGLGACQCWTDQAMVRHVTLVLVTFRGPATPAHRPGRKRRRGQGALPAGHRPAGPTTTHP